MRVAGVILAAGASRRLGRAKQLVEIGGERLLDRAVRIAREAGLETVVVLGCGADAIEGECGLSGVKVVRNERWEDGMGGSVAVGIGAVMGWADASVVMTCDQPAVTVEHLRELVRRCGGTATVGSGYGGRCGVPACFPATRFGELLGLEGDSGARAMLTGAECLELRHGALDVDTEEELQEAARVLAERA